MIENDNPLISVIVPVYNVSAYLENTLQTIVTQTYRNLEIILVDDGSTDGSGDICDVWACMDYRIRVLHQENKGPACARNAALDVASGAYILFSDSDDLLSPDLCQTLLRIMIPEVKIAVCDIVHSFLGQPCEFSVSDDYTLEEAQTVIQKLWYQTGLLPSACAKLYCRSIFDVHRFTPGLFFEDIDLLHELFWTAGRIAYTPSRLYGYVHREGSITTRPFSAKDLDIFQVTKRILKFAEERPALMGSAQAYAVTAALRIYLNAPRTGEYADAVATAQQLIGQYGKAVIQDRNIRKKNKYALWLYFICRPVLPFIYRYINRWK